MALATRLLGGLAIAVVSAFGTFALREKFLRPSPVVSPQRLGPAPAPPVSLATNVTDAATPVAESQAGSALSDVLCPEEMAWVDTSSCEPGMVQALCAQKRRLKFCVDRHEYPNQPGAWPAVMLTFLEARALCRAEDKRLCRQSEWAAACLGTRSLTSCNFGRTSRHVRPAVLREPMRVSTELAQQDGRRPSRVGACVSEHGVFDMPGNVQEWVRSERGENYQAALKGGRFNQSSVGCDTVIQTREPLLRWSHTGFRCCRDPLVEPPEETQPG